MGGVGHGWVNVGGQGAGGEDEGRVGGIADGVKNVAHEAVAADAFDRAFAEEGAEGGIVEPGKVGEAGWFGALGCVFLFGRGGGEFVPGADGEAIIAAIDAVAEKGAEVGGDRAMVFDGQVRNAAPRINLLSRDLGNWFFLGAIFTTLALPPDAAEVSHCGTCTACLDICPTKAFPAPYQLDARRCISYLTIEHHGPVDPALRPHLGNRIYGCDDCLAVCPWNKFAATASELKYAARSAEPPRLADLARLDDQTFRALFTKSPVKRIGRNRFVRNVLYAIGNSADPTLLATARALTTDPDPTVADAATWACNRLAKAPPPAN